MASVSQISSLAKQVYGESDRRVKELEQMYNTTESQIEGIISHFVSDEDNWSTPAPKRLKQRLLDELASMYKQASEDDRSLISVSFVNRKIETTSDAMKIAAGIALIKLAQSRKKQLDETLDQIPQLVRTTGYRKVSSSVRRNLRQRLQREPTKIEHQTAMVQRFPGHYHKQLEQRAVSNMVKQFGSGVDINQSINRDTAALMNRTNQMIDNIIQNHRKPQDYSKDLARLFTGDENSKGAVGSAERLLRTESAYTLSNAQKDDFTKRGVRYFTNVAIMGRTTCRHCKNMDGTTFRVSDMEPGINCRPFHPNCQCDVVEATQSDIRNAGFTIE